jgi:membrane-associated phospholipid phosphatase
MTDPRARRRLPFTLVACCSLAVLTAGNAVAQTNSQPSPAPVTSSTFAPERLNGVPSTLPDRLNGVPSTSMPSVLADAVMDFRHIPSWTNLAIIAAGGFGAAIGHSADSYVSRSMSGSQSLGSFFRIGETVGGARTQLAAALGTYAIGQISGQRKVSVVGAHLIQAQILTQTMTAAIKTSVGRTRPDGTQFSFPSGHSSVTFATATVLQRDLGWKAGVPAFGLATYVAASRIQDKRHFLSDVTFGAAIGIIAGRSVTVGHGNTKFAVAPTAAPGGGGISFTWLGSSR